MHLHLSSSGYYELTFTIGQATLPESCPVCDHSPLSPDDCRPNKSLRLTVKAFLKNEEKKRDKGRAADKSVKTPVSAAVQEAGEKIVADTDVASEALATDTRPDTPTESEPFALPAAEPTVAGAVDPVGPISL